MVDAVPLTNQQTNMDQTLITEELQKIIQPVLEKQTIELVELRFIRTSGRAMIRLLVDKKDGAIRLQDCAQLNRQIGRLLDERNIIEEHYILEVSSPGLDRPLVTKNDFIRCIERQVKLFLKQPVNGEMEISGFIKEVEADIVIVKVNEESLRIPLSYITMGKQIF